MDGNRAVLSAENCKNPSTAVILTVFRSSFAAQGKWKEEAVARPICSSLLISAMVWMAPLLSGGSLLIYDAAAQSSSTDNSSNRRPESMIDEGNTGPTHTKPSLKTDPRERRASRGRSDDGKAGKVSSRTFINPKYKGHWVDRCLSFGTRCDKPAGDEFCRRMGYARSTSIAWAYKGRTLTLGSGQICSAPWCGGLTRVVCTR